MCLRRASWPADNHFLLGSHCRSLALGYFMLTLIMVITGRVLYGETMSGWQKIAVLLAVFGVTAEVMMTRSLPLLALVVIHA